MSRTYQLSELSNLRTELMGFGAILILICHSVAYIDMPSFLHYALSFGNIGVDIFLFLSGMGNWYSLSKSTNTGGVIHWYLHRYSKLFIPYLFVVIPMNAIELSIGWFEGESLWNYLFGLTTLRFYVSHDAPWFIAALIPLYLLAPLLYRLIKAFQWKATILLIGVLYLTLTIPPMFNSEILNNVITNVQFVTIRATSTL